VALVKTVEMRVLVDAGDAQARLDELDAKAKDLDGNAIKMRFRLDDAEGKAQIDDLRAKADKLGFKDVSIKVRVDGAGRAIAELDAVKREEEKARRGGGILDRLGGIGSALVTPLAPDAGGIMGVLSNPAALTGIATAAAGALVEVTGLASGFAAAGAGAAAFYLLAHPAIANLTGDVTALNAANQAVGYARQVEKIDPTKAHALALKDARDKYQAVYQQMGQDAGGAATGMIRLHDEYGKLTTAFAPDVFKVFNAGLKVANNLLPAALPFAKTFADVLTTLLTQAGKFTQSKGFGDFLKQFHSIEGPALGAIGEGIGRVAVSVGKLLTTMSGKDVAHSVNILFDGIAGTISAVSAVVTGTMKTWDSASHGLSSTFDQSMGQVKSAIRGVASAFDGLRHGVASTVGGVISVMASLPGKIKGIYAGAGGWLVSAGMWLVTGFGKGAMATWGAVSGWLSGLNGKITGFFSGAAGWLVSAGEAVMSGFLSGLESGWGKVTSFVGGIGGWIARHKGPLEYDRQLLVPHGQAIMAGLMAGIGSQVPALGAQLAGITRGIQVAAGTAGGYGHGGDHIEVHIHSLQGTNEIARAMVQTLKQYKRNGGGAALGIA